MVRQYKSRRVAFVPGAKYFKPMGIPLKCLEEVRLTVEEAEAVRLKDLERLDQEQGAAEMNVSRPTFQRVLGSARRKMADALLKGKAIRIEGGHYELAPVQFRCANGHAWSVLSESVTKTNPQTCPTCNTPDVGLVAPARADCPFEGRYLCCSHCPRILIPGAKPGVINAGVVDTVRE